MDIKATQRILNVLIILALSGLVFVVGYPQFMELRPVHVKIGIDRSYAGLPFYVAETDTSRRYFDIEKVKPDFIEVRDSPLEAVKRGEIDVAAVSWYSLIIHSSDNGDTVKAFGSLEMRDVSDGIIIPRNSKQVRKIRDLSGKRLGYLAEEEYILDLILPKLDLQDNVKKPVKVALLPGDVVTAFKDNKVDALFLLDPYRSHMLWQGDTVLYEGLVNRYIMNSFPYMALVMRKDYLKENKRAAIRIKKVYDAAVGFLRVHPDIGKNILAKKMNFPVEGILILNMRMPEYQRLVETDLKRIEYLQKLLVQAGVVSCGMKPQEFLFKKEDFLK